jgi:hypothetical protein
MQLLLHSWSGRDLLLLLLLHQLLQRWLHRWLLLLPSCVPILRLPVTALLLLLLLLVAGQGQSCCWFLMLQVLLRMRAVQCRGHSLLQVHLLLPLLLLLVLLLEREFLKRRSLQLLLLCHVLCQRRRKQLLSICGLLSCQLELLCQAWGCNRLLFGNSTLCSYLLRTLCRSACSEGVILWDCAITSHCCCCC